MHKNYKLLLKVLLISILLFLNTTPTFASTQDFYFKDYTADYYLTKAADGSSKLHVKEVLTAVFPETDQNHGITRTIPLTNQAGKNRTVESKEALNFTALRNGKEEPIAKFVNDRSVYTFYLGKSNEYVHGEQIYTLEYDFTNVITEFDKLGNNVSGKGSTSAVFQELYWDTNGTDWQQKFEKLTVNFHIESSLVSSLDDETWCYVGKYGVKGQERCQTKKTADGFSFTTENLESGENLTFVVHMSPKTFQVIVKRNYILVWLLGIVVVICLIFIAIAIRKWIKNGKSAYDTYKSLFTAPQYQRPKDEHIRVAEAEELYIKNTKKSYVASLLELAIEKKISVIKSKDSGGKNEWAIQMNVSKGEMSMPQRMVLEILNGGTGPEQGNIIKVEKHKPTQQLADCVDLYHSSAKRALERHEYFKEDSNSNLSQSVAKTFMITLLFTTLFPIGLGLTLAVLGRNIRTQEYVEIVGKSYIPIIIFILIIATIIIIILVNKATKKYKPYTTRGVEMVNYLEGLETYIKMAEKDRLKFLQSVDGADVSNEGIVKIYEQLLPWASLFGAEESWLKELNKYCEYANVTTDFDQTFMDGISTGSIASSVMRSLESSTDYHAPVSFNVSSGDSGWSSSDFGGGGSSSDSGGGSSGGSGGGGGGGGGGGW